MKMKRGKQQILFNYLPGRTFDFDKSNRLAQITSIRGIQKTDLNVALVLQAIERYAFTWQLELARVFHHPEVDQFVLVQPSRVYSQTYPKVMWCQACGAVFDYRQRSQLPNSNCQNCQNSKLSQLRWVKVHRCGHIEELVPPYQCQNCRARSQFKLNTRNSERITGFRWICRGCGTPANLFGGYCRSCNWQELTGEGDKSLRQMNIEVHRAGRTYYPHYVELLNQPGAEMDRLLAMNDWQFIAAAIFLQLPQIQGRRLMEFAHLGQNNPRIQLETSLEEVVQLRAMGLDDSRINDFLQLQTTLNDLRQNQQQNQSLGDIKHNVIAQTGVSEVAWLNAGQEMLEAVLPSETGQTKELFDLNNPTLNQQDACGIARGMGIARLMLTTDFPMTLATFGYSRVSYKPNECRLNPFPPDDEHTGRFPIFVDMIQADAIIVRLDSARLLRWLDLNDFPPDLLMNTPNTDVARQGYFVQLFDEVPLRQRLTNSEAECRMVFGLMHTMSHLFIRRASLLCGLDKTSLSEYVLPRALTFAIYCSHRQGATIGALASLFEDSLAEWLHQILVDTRRCVYDPVCHRQHGGNCHACTHLSETSCRFFNLNLGRCFLFGGWDEELGDIRGYFDSSLNIEPYHG